ncbi:MAG: tetratricopeptide repeat protein [Bacteroidetes bacterium]|jgi:serine/threonine-protein kinase|nr:tetratricopeptide repeat protein [Bacteroidota bacterium]
MDAQRWETIQDLFDRAIARPETERMSFLDAACGDDIDLRMEVESLLGAHGATGPLDRLARDLMGSWSASLDRASREGDRVGPYRIVREIGRGGMGTVYLAERDDGTYEQRVALKVVRYRLAGEDLLVRFLNERQILARLQHPNIARLLDGGVTDDGLPYFAMEYVDGQAVDVYCDARRLSVRERIRLFITICRTVSHAHQNLIVHRDLKPANLLVTDDGALRLLDFGIAKLLEEAGPEHRTTRTGMAVMTPEYASPEQVRGGPVTTATDVYALGVLLYELLSGCRPYDLHNATPADLERLVCDRAPVAPSDRLAETSGDSPMQQASARGTTADGLRRQLTGDLDTIILKALRKDPDRRYASADALADDLQRHLDGLPVRARPDTALYRAGKFIRRHRVGVSAGALVILALVGGLGIALSQARIASAERDVAREETERAERISGFLVDIFRAPDPSRSLGDTLTAFDLLDRGEEMLNDDLGDQPLTRAALLSVLGETHTSHGSYADASRLLDTALVLQRHHGAPTVERSRTLRSLAKAEVLGGRLERAESLYGDGLSALRATPDADSLDVGAILSELGSLHLEQGAYDRAEARLRQAMNVLAFSQDADSVAVQTARMSTLQHLALLHQETGRLDEAVPVFEQLLAMQRKRLPTPHPTLALLLNDFGMTLQRLGDRDRAEALLSKAIQMQRELFDGDHPQLIFTLSNLAAAVDDTNLPLADSLTDEALSMALRVLEPDNPVTATSLALRAQVVHKTGRLEVADALFIRAIDAARRAFPPGHPRIGWATVGHARVLAERGRHSEAIRHVREGTAILVDAFGPTHTLVLRAQRWHAQILADTGAGDAAAAMLRRQHETLRSTLGEDDRETRETERLLAKLEP